MGLTALLCENPTKIQGSYDKVIYWASFESSPDSISLPDVVEKDAEILREQYFDWLFELGNSLINGRRIIEHFRIRENFSFWWMSLMVEKSQWKSPGLYKLFRLLALERLSRQYDIKKLIISISLDKDVRKAILTFCQRAGIKVKIKAQEKKRAPLNLRQLFNTLPFIFQAILSLFNYLVHRWPIRHSRRCEKENLVSGGITFISYLFNFDRKHADQDAFYSKYWTRLHDLISKQSMNVSWLHLFIRSDQVPDASHAVRLAGRFNKKTYDQIHYLLDSGLGWKVVMGVVKDYCRICYASLKLGRVQHLFNMQNSMVNFWPVFETDWKSSFLGVTAISNCLFLNLFEAVLSRIPYQKKGFYLLENQPWERSLIYAWKNAGHGSLTGVAHTTVSSWDLRHFFSPLEYTHNNRFQLPIPDRVALNGQAAINAYRKGGFPEDRISKAEALRYLYLDSQSNCQRVRENISEKRLLILGDYLPEVTNRQMKIVSDASKNLPKDIKILVKAHPACPIHAEDWPQVQMQITKKTLDELTHDYNVAFTSNATAAAVDSYLAGKKVFVAMDPESFNMSPLRGYPSVEFVATGAQLAQNLAKKIREPAKVDNSFFYTDQKLDKWRELLDA